MPPRKIYYIHYTIKVNSGLNLGKDFTCFLQGRKERKNLIVSHWVLVYND